jgi:hypothetical protein
MLKEKTMRSNLNSILIEGKVSNVNYVNYVCTFRITTRKVLGSGEYVLSSFTCETTNNLAEMLSKTLGVGSYARVVGHLSSADEKVKIVAEHVEIKPLPVVVEEEEEEEEEEDDEYEYEGDD